MLSGDFHTHERDFQSPIGNAQFLFLCNPPPLPHPKKNQALTSLYHFVTQKNTNWRHISLARGDHWDSKLSANIQCEKNNLSVFSNFPKICKKIHKKSMFLANFWQITEYSHGYLHCTVSSWHQKLIFICIIP